MRVKQKIVVYKVGGLRKKEYFAPATFFNPFTCPPMKYNSLTSFTGLLLATLCAGPAAAQIAPPPPQWLSKPPRP